MNRNLIQGLSIKILYKELFVCVEVCVRVHIILNPSNNESKANSRLEYQHPIEGLICMGDNLYAQIQCWGNNSKIQKFRLKHESFNQLNQSHGHFIKKTSVETLPNLYAFCEKLFKSEQVDLCRYRQTITTNKVLLKPNR